MSTSPICCPSCRPVHQQLSSPPSVLILCSVVFFPASFFISGGELLNLFCILLFCCDYYHLHGHHHFSFSPLIGQHQPPSPLFCVEGFPPPQRVQFITEGWTGPHHPCLFLDHSPPTPLTELHHLSSRLSLVEQHHQHHRSWFESRSVHPFTLSISLWSWSSSPPWKQLSTSAPLNHRLHLTLSASSPYLLWLLLLGSGMCRVGEATFLSPASISSGRLLFNSELSGLLCSC